MCNVNECDSKVYCKYLCTLHYGRFVRTGKTDAPISKTVEQRFNEKVDTEGVCHEWVGARNTEGYGNFYLKGKIVKAHRVSYQLAYGDFDKTLQVLHKCDNPCCVNPEHLFLGTGTDNMQDMFSKGREADRSGEANGNKRVNEVAVRIIRYMSFIGKSHRVIARAYGIGQTTVSDIVNRRTWGEVQ